MTKLRIYLLAGLWSLSPVLAYGEEGLVPYIPGATTGVPVGALPPPGFYGTEDILNVSGEIKGAAGQGIPIYLSVTGEVTSLLYSTPYHILGAQIGFGIVQLSSFHQADTRGVGGIRTGEYGFFNTDLQPIILSYAINQNVFISTAQSVYMPNGDYHYNGATRLQTTFANPFATYEPSFAISYLKDGLNLTANNVFDFNTKNSKNDYQSGSVYYLDLTAAQTIGKWTFGLIGNYTQQFTNDYQYGVKVGDGNRVQHVMLGPLLEYNFGPLAVTARYLNDVKTRNDVAFHLPQISVSGKF